MAWGNSMHKIITNHTHNRSRVNGGERGSRDSAGDPIGYSLLASYLSSIGSSLGSVGGGMTIPITTVLVPFAWAAAWRHGYYRNRWCSGGTGMDIHNIHALSLDPACLREAFPMVYWWIGWHDGLQGTMTSIRQPHTSSEQLQCYQPT